MIANRIITTLAILFILAVPVAGAGFVYIGNKVPWGTFTTTKTVEQRSAFIDDLKPEQRVSAVQYTEEGKPYQTITGDPVWFFSHPQTSFSSVDATIVFRNKTTPIIELGGLAREEGQIYDLYPLQHQLLDVLPWPKMTQNGLILYQKYPTYTSIEAFFANPPEDRSTIATYHTPLTTPVRFTNDRPTTTQQKTPVSLRGFHELKLYVTEKEALRFSLTYQDMNRTPGPDPVQVVIINEQRQQVAQQSFEDDQNETNNATPSILKTITFTTDPLPEGVYKIELRAANDIFWRTIETTARKWVVLNTIFLADEVGYRDNTPPITLWTTTKSLALQTPHIEGIQKVKANQQTFDIATAQTRFPFTIEDTGLVSIAFQKPDVLLQANGVFSFTKDAYFEPDPKRLVWNTDLEKETISYILTDYTPPTHVGGDWYEKTIHFNPAILVQNNGTWKFVFSAPGIEDANASFDLSSIRMLWGK